MTRVLTSQPRFKVVGIGNLAGNVVERLRSGCSAPEVEYLRIDAALEGGASGAHAISNVASSDALIGTGIVLLIADIRDTAASATIATVGSAAQKAGVSVITILRASSATESPDAAGVATIVSCDSPLLASGSRFLESKLVGEQPTEQALAERITYRLASTILGSLTAIWTDVEVYRRSPPKAAEWDLIEDMRIRTRELRLLTNRLASASTRVEAAVARAAEMNASYYDASSALHAAMARLYEASQRGPGIPDLETELAAAQEQFETCRLAAEKMLPALRQARVVHELALDELRQTREHLTCEVAALEESRRYFDGHDMARDCAAAYQQAIRDAEDAIDAATQAIDVLLPSGQDS